MTDLKKKIPCHLRVIGFLCGLVTNRYIALFLSFLILSVGYLVDCYFKMPKFFAGSASLITMFGLILTIKNHYLVNISNVKNLVLSDYEESSCGPSHEDLMQNNKYLDTLFDKATDEGVGLVLILLGTILNVFGVYIPLISLCLAT